MNRFRVCPIVLTAALVLITATATAADELEKKIGAEMGGYPGLLMSVLGCDRAVPIGLGQTVGGDTRGAETMVFLYDCGYPWNESGGEVVYMLNLTRPTTVTAHLHDLSADLDLFLLEKCDESSCLAFGDNEFATDCLDAGTYYLIVDGYNGAEGLYNLTVEGVDCGGVPNETCEEAIDLCGVVDGNGDFEIECSTIGAADDYDLHFGNPHTGHVARGGDVVYRVCLESGGSIEVTRTGDYDMALYLVTDCSDPVGSCVAGTDKCCDGVSEQIIFTSRGGGSYYLIVDGWNSEGYGTLFGNITGCCVTSTEEKSWGDVKRQFR